MAWPGPAAGEGSAGKDWVGCVVRGVLGEGLMTPLLHSYKRIWLCALRRMRPFVDARIHSYLTPHRVELLRKVFAHLNVNIEGERDPRGGVLQAEIVEDFKVHKSSISRMLSKMERDGFIRRTRWSKNLLFKVVHLTELGFEMMATIRELRFEEDAPDAQIEKAILGDQRTTSDREARYRQCNAIRIGLGDDAKHLHPWQLCDGEEQIEDPTLGIFVWRLCRLRIDDVDDRILDTCPDDYLDEFGPFRGAPDAPPSEWRVPRVA